MEVAGKLIQRRGFYYAIHVMARTLCTSRHMRRGENEWQKTTFLAQNFGVKVVRVICLVAWSAYLRNYKLDLRN